MYRFHPSVRWDSGYPTREQIATFLQAFDSEADRQKFCSGNAAALFGI